MRRGTELTEWKQMTSALHIFLLLEIINWSAPGGAEEYVTFSD